MRLRLLSIALEIVVAIVAVQMAWMTLEAAGSSVVLRVRIVDVSSRAIPSAKWGVYKKSPRIGWLLPATQTVDQKGESQATVDLESNAKYVVEAEVAGHKNLSDVFSVSDGRASVIELVIRFPAQSPMLSTREQSPGLAPITTAQESAQSTPPPEKAAQNTAPERSEPPDVQTLGRRMNAALVLIGLLLAIVLTDVLVRVYRGRDSAPLGPMVKMVTDMDRTVGSIYSDTRNLRTDTSTILIRVDNRDVLTAIGRAQSQLDRLTANLRDAPNESQNDAPNWPAVASLQVLGASLAFVAPVGGFATEALSSYQAITRGDSPRVRPRYLILDNATFEGPEVSPKTPCFREVKDRSAQFLAFVQPGDQASGLLFPSPVKTFPNEVSLAFPQLRSDNWETMKAQLEPRAITQSADGLWKLTAG